METPMLITLLLLLLVILYMCGTSKLNYRSENMAPLDWGTYKNNYPRGECNQGSFEQTACSVGNCPLGTTVTDQRFCGIQCAQDPDPVSRKECYDYCMNMMKGCH